MEVRAGGLGCSVKSVSNHEISCTVGAGES